jgi:Phage gp6-like head-tail connector protein
MQSTVVVVTPAASIDLITLDELKRALNLTSTVQDAMLTDLITQVSAEVAAYCNNRVFGFETVVETFTELSAETRRLFLARYPVAVDGGITSINNGDAVLTYPGTMLLDSLWGKLTLASGGAFIEQTVIAYSGGYNLPDEAPPALKRAVVMLAREAYYSTLRGDASVRMVAHKESRIIYFDPNVLAKSGGGGSHGTAAQRAAADLLTHFTRYEV